MALLDEIQVAYKEAFKAREMEKKMALNMVLAQIKQKEIDTREDVSDEMILAIIKKEVKAVNETISFLKNAGKEEQIVEENKKLEVLQVYLPTLFSEEKTQEILTATIAELGITDLQKERGKVIGAIMGKYKGEVDGRILQGLIIEGKS